MTYNELDRELFDEEDEAPLVKPQRFPREDPSVQSLVETPLADDYCSVDHCRYTFNNSDRRGCCSET